MAYIEVTPAYGRDYTRAADAKADWKGNKDFQVSESSGSAARYGQYVTRAELASLEPATRVIIRYAKLERVTQA